MSPGSPEAAALTDRERACWEQHWSGKIQWLLSYDDAVRYLTAERKLQDAEKEIARLKQMLWLSGHRVVDLPDEQRPEQVGASELPGGQRDAGESSLTCPS